MAEAVAVVGLVASIVQLVEFGSSVAARLRDFQSRAQDVSATLRGIQTQLPLLLEAMKCIEEQADSELFIEQRAKALQPVVKGCEQAVEKINSLLTTTLPADGRQPGKIFSKPSKAYLATNKLSSSLHFSKQYRCSYITSSEYVKAHPKDWVTIRLSLTANPSSWNPILVISCLWVARLSLPTWRRN